MKKNEKVLWVIIALAAVVYLFPVAQHNLAFARSKPLEHETAPDFSLKDLGGRNVHLSDYKGKVVLVNFFASWCPPCRMEIPGFERMHTSYRNRGFAVIGVALDNVPPSFIKAMGMTYPVVEANDTVIGDYGNISSMPVSFLVGKNGRIIKKVMGLYSETSLKNDVENALKGRI